MISSNWRTSEGFPAYLGWPPKSFIAQANILSLQSGKTELELLRQYAFLLLSGYLALLVPTRNQKFRDPTTPKTQQWSGHSYHQVTACLVPYPSPKMSRHSCLAFLKFLPTSAFPFPSSEKEPKLGVPFFSFF